MLQIEEGFKGAWSTARILTCHESPAPILVVHYMYVDFVDGVGEPIEETVTLDRARPVPAGHLDFSSFLQQLTTGAPLEARVHDCVWPVRCARPRKPRAWVPRRRRSV